MFKQINNVLSRCALPISKQAIRHRYALRGKKPHEAKSLAQLLAEYNYVDPEIAAKIDIGLPPPPRSREQELKRTQTIRQLKRDASLEKAARNMQLNIPTIEIKNIWETTDGPEHLRMAAEHYGVYQDLFGDAFFNPRVPLDITYKQKDDLLAPVHRGNVVKPAEAINEPNVSFESGPEDFWTLILTNPDGHLSEENKECLHWFVGNIPGNAVSKGEVIVNYLQPFPPLGVGFQRMVFVLYKQSRRLDFSALKKKSPCNELSERTFETLEFYRARQDDLTPAGLAFFQTDWDNSVRNTFHQTLNMEQPTFEYEFPKPYVAPPRWFARKKAFNMYLDKYRDPKDIAKDFLVKKLDKLDPFEKPKKPFPYQNIFRVNRRETPSWLLTEQRRVKLGLGRINLQKDD